MQLSHAEKKTHQPLKGIKRNKIKGNTKEMVILARSNARSNDTSFRSLAFNTLNLTDFGYKLHTKKANVFCMIFSDSARGKSDRLVCDRALPIGDNEEMVALIEKGGNMGETTVI